ncbi:YgaB family protein [Heyndrickxia acidiproducens]|jgi:hypothetical protein|uniref:YgaB family protein n=1 Tax=Heyndrickxia acidiproducens TaxID=1121084 RepID=UPI0003723C78|nr:YgaB family protein [Heyndrickxia acidiproducens]
MENFNEIVLKQMDTMGKLLYLQSEIERCQKVKRELQKLQEETKVDSIKEEIAQMNSQLFEIQDVFETQTIELIQVYHKTKIC